MGKTVEAFRIALEGEINRWSGFARALRKHDREAFDELMDMCRSYPSESSDATNLIPFEPMVMSILLAQQVRIQKLERQLNDVPLQRDGELPMAKLADENIFNKLDNLDSSSTLETCSRGVVISDNCQA